eukprot:Rmarinus@m.4762
MEAVRSQLEDTLQCPICNEIYDLESRRPRGFPCCHTFCSRCIARLLDKAKMSGVESTHRISCPICRNVVEVSAVTDLNVNYSVEDIIPTLHLASLGPKKKRTMRTWLPGAIVVLFTLLIGLYLYGKNLGAGSTHEISVPDDALRHVAVGVSKLVPENFTNTVLVFVLSLAVTLALRHRRQGDDTQLLFNAAQHHYERGELTKARDIHREVLKRRCEAVGPSHPTAILSMMHLGKIFVELGDYHSARALYEDFLQDHKKKLGEDDIHVLSIMHNLATVYDYLFKYGKARAMYEDCLSRRLRVLGPDHSQTLSTLNSLASTKFHQKDYEGAKLIFSECLRKRKETLGSNHSLTLSTMNNIGELYTAMGRYESAEVMHEECLARRRKTLGDNHVDTLHSMNHYGLALHYRGRNDKAERVILECVTRRKVLCGEGHVHTLTCQVNLANVLYRLGRIHEAARLCQRCVSRGREELGPGDARVAEWQRIYDKMVEGQAKKREEWENQ